MIENELIKKSDVLKLIEDIKCNDRIPKNYGTLLDIMKEIRLMSDVQKHGHWTLLTNCSNSGCYCSVCNKKVYKENYGNAKMISKYCPNCGAIMDGKLETY